jgi:hypothetical protein
MKNLKLNGVSNTLNLPIEAKEIHTGSTAVSSSVNVNSTETYKTTSTTIWIGGYVTDNYSSYYLDKNMVKHY